MLEENVRVGLDVNIKRKCSELSVRSTGEFWGKFFALGYALAYCRI